VKGVGFDSWRRVGTTIPAIKVYNTRQVDEMIVVDILASKNNAEPDYKAVEDFSTRSGKQRCARNNEARK
jgi:cyclase